jgi:hypothetical protein
MVLLVVDAHPGHKRCRPLPSKEHHMSERLSSGTYKHMRSGVSKTIVLAKILPPTQLLT